ncbi:protein kinase-like domain, Phloem protein 2-like protein [Artemisia annua]|uniref:Protein kinase-like domain, Phloem protein 2-like protein n=1 Tax=Artemisia annua TaxID=35608 RepID=A0A2U1NFF9_ARTAN|nr:protein kinase-like domain, Phloem protein 2-like protein [Artemisia annua]
MYTIPMRRVPVQGLEHLKISFSDVKSAATDKSRIRSVHTQRQAFAIIVYKAQLMIFDSKNYLEIEGKCKSELPKKMSSVIIKRYFDYPLFYDEMSALSWYKHPNIVSVHGICEEPVEKIIVYGDVTNGCLADYLGSARNIDNFTWVRRIRLCLDIAHGLDYIHHRRFGNKETSSQHIISSSNILLKENWEAMIGGFSEEDHSGPSTSRFKDRNYNFHKEFYGGDRKEKDIYCFGIVLFEILCWRFAHDPVYQRKNDKGLASFVRRCFKNGTRNEILDLKLREEAEETIFSKGIDKKSLDTFSNIAYQCLGDSHFQRPTLNHVIEELEKALYFQSIHDSQENTSKDNLKFSLDEIMLATQNFNQRIGKGGFGQVYKGEFTYTHGSEHIAAKRLDKKSDQGITELMTEFEILSDYKHENIVGLVGYCDEREEKIIVYEYACRGSLDSWLEDDALTWRKRLEICIDIANGLAFLHGTSETKQEVVIHRDIKSANVLLHGDWQAKIADFGLSLISPINHEMNYVIDNAKGTPGYCDPLYISTRFFTKESDIYSFGVLLFEMLCGRFVMDNKNSKAQNLVQLVKHHYKEGSLYELVFEATKKQMAPRSLTTFQNIAYQCIHEEREKRPTAKDVLIQLKKALEFQLGFHDAQEKREHLQISLDDIMLGTQDFSLENLLGNGRFRQVYKGEVRLADGHELIAARQFDKKSNQGDTELMTELEILLEYKHDNVIGLLGYCHEKGENILVYEYASRGSLDRLLKSDGLTWRKRLEICIDITRGLAFIHGTSGAKQEVMLCGRSVMENSGSRAHNLVHLVRHHFEEGILYEIVFEATKKQMVPASLTAFQNIAYQCIHEEREKRPTANDVLIQLKKALEFQEVMEIWKSKLPRDYERLIQTPDSPEIYYAMNNKYLYTWLHKGILHPDHKLFFSFGTNGGRVETISAIEFQFKSYYRPNKWRTLSKSRFGEVVQISDSSSMNIQISVKTQLLSPGVDYGVYLVYKFCRPIDESTIRTHTLAIKMGSEDFFPEFTTRRDNDGWMRIELYRFSNLKEEANFDAFLKGFSEDPFKNVAIYVEGVEFQPISN